MPQVSGGVTLPEAPTSAFPAHSLLPPPPACLSLCAQVWSEVSRSLAPTPNPGSRPVPLAGSASRRCLLSAQGVAYWGLPSFARCISHEYRYLYLSVSVPRWAGVAQGLSQARARGGGSLLPALARVPWHTYAVPTSACLCLSLPSTLLFIPQGLTLKCLPLFLAPPSVAPLVPRASQS